MTETNKRRRAYALGVDPGTTTGLSVVRFYLDGGLPQLVWADQLLWELAALEVARQVRRLRATHKAGDAVNVVVACEKFTLNAQTAQRGQEPAEDSMGMVGVVREHCLLNAVPRAKLEQASAAKLVATDTLLKSLCLHKTGRKHVNDATRQAVLYAVKNRWIESRLLGTVFS